MSLWRIIKDPPSDGVLNMASDEALFLACRDRELKGESNLPILRLYFWKAPEISLGYNQKYELLKDLPLGKVRRITGGKAVLHLPSSYELTYSVICPKDSDIFKVGIRQSYCLLSKAFISALLKIGINGKLESSSNDSLSSEACFVSSGAEEVSVNGKKLIGSAQRRRNWGFVQQGSVVLSKHPELVDSIFGSGVSDSFSAIDEYSDSGIDFFIKALEDSFSKVLDCQFEQSSYTEQETNLIKVLKEDKYSSKDWLINKKCNYDKDECYLYTN